jgi:hypothetical protein
VLCHRRVNSLLEQGERRAAGRDAKVHCSKSDRPVLGYEFRAFAPIVSACEIEE